jgi:hypothetical protein
VRAWHRHETEDELKARLAFYAKLILSPRGGDLSPEDLGSVLPPRGPRGCIQNIVRRDICADLRRRGFLLPPARAAR